MTELFEIGRHILERSRRLLALPAQAELPPAYTSLLRDPADLLAETWGALPAEPTAAPSPDVGDAERARGRQGMRAQGSGGALSDLSEVRAALAKPLEADVVWLKPGIAPGGTSQAESSAAGGPTPLLSATPSRLGAVGGDPTGAAGTELPESVTKGQEASPLAPAEGFGSQSGSRNRPAEAQTSDALTRTAPARVIGLFAPAPAAPEDKVPFDEEARASHPGERRREPGRRSERLAGRVAEDVYDFGEGGDEVRAAFTAAPAQQPERPTAFTPLTSLMSKNVTPGNVVAVPSPLAQAPQSPDAVSGGNSPWARRQGAEEREAEEGAAEQGRARQPTAPLVEEVLEELYERLRLEYLRAYGTTGG